MTLVFTLCSNNYLAQAHTLFNSLLKHNQAYRFVVGLVDKKNALIDYSKLPFDILEVENIKITQWESMILRYNIQELNTAVKPYFFKYFLAHSEFGDTIIYLDPDIQVFQPFSNLEKILEMSDIVITPHITMPVDDDKLPSENEILNTGMYNLGFLALRATENSRLMIDWWADRLAIKGYNDVANGMFTDQIWINFVPLFYKNVYVFFDPGYNTAYWNLHERFISVHNNTYIVNDKYPLVFYHFSGFYPLIPQNISKYQTRFTFGQRPDIAPLFVEYAQKLINNGYKHYQSFKCIYNGIKEQNDDRLVLQQVRKIPLSKRVIAKLINRFTKRFNIILDYSIYYDRKYLEQLRK